MEKNGKEHAELALKFIGLICQNHFNGTKKISKDTRSIYDIVADYFNDYSTIEELQTFIEKNKLRDK